MHNSSDSRGDIFLSIAVISQCFLNILQQCSIIWGVSHSMRVVGRVVLSAVPVFFAMYYVMKRNPALTLQTYLCAIAILFIQCILFPLNISYLAEESLMFMLPISIPIFLSVASIKNLQKFVQYLEYGSWASVFLGLIYVFEYFRGVFIIEQYNMSFGYGLLLPAMVLYNRKTKLSVLGTIFSLIMILSIGSRGPLVILLLYIVYDIFYNEKRYIPLLLIVGFFVPIFLVYLADYLETIGIYSRNISVLTSLLSNDVEENMSDIARSELIEKTFYVFKDYQVVGLGIFGDRPILGGYIHNIFIEILIDWGIFLGPILILFLILFLLKTFLSVPSIYKNIYVIFVCAGFLPLLKSGSYLVDFNFYALLGFFVYFNRKINTF